MKAIYKLLENLVNSLESIESRLTNLELEQKRKVAELEKRLDGLRF